MKHTKTFISIFILLPLFFTGCSILAADEPTPDPNATPIPTSTPPPTEESALTDTPVPMTTKTPTDKPIPTDTLQPTKTPLPEGVLFRDDFEGNLHSSWEWQYENPDRWAITDDGWLQIVGESQSLLGDGRQSNLLWLSLPEGNFVITAHLKTQPHTNFHQATIYIYENNENYVAINRGYCDICETGGGGFFMEYKIGGAWGAYQAATDADDIFLRLESSADVISGYYAVEDGLWERLGRFGNFFKFSRVGIGVTNAGAAEDIAGFFDYFEISTR